jgi:ATP-dependent RNA helicase DHX29
VTPTEEVSINGTKKAGVASNGIGNSQTPEAQSPIPEEQNADQGDVDISDLDSDIELDELIPTYLKIKGKLYEIDPDLVETATRKQSKNAKGKKEPSNQAKQSPSTRKLLSQMQKITSDALFDEWEAEAQWPAKRNQIAQDRATTRQKQESAPRGEEQAEEPITPIPTIASNPDLPLTTTDASGSEDEADLLGGMFSAVPDALEPRPVDTKDSASDDIALRDFGKSSGLTPRRLLEEAVRSR